MPRPEEIRREKLSSASRPTLSDALSVDVEDYYQVEAFADRVSPSSWSDFPSRVRANTNRVLEMFEEYRCRATFFILGWVAEREPDLVREIVRAGHEVACHSYSHRRVSSLTPEEFRRDLQRVQILRGILRRLPGHRTAAAIHVRRSELSRESLPRLPRLLLLVPICAATRVRPEFAQGFCRSSPGNI